MYQRLVLVYLFCALFACGPRLSVTPKEVSQGPVLPPVAFDRDDEDPPATSWPRPLPPPPPPAPPPPPPPPQVRYVLPNEMFIMNGTGYFSDGGGGYCIVVDWPQWLRMGGPSQNWPVRTEIPGNPQNIPFCQN